MATIQIRDVPDDAYEVLRRRARRAGQSLQAYMRDEAVALAARPSKAEALAEIENWLVRTGGVRTPVAEIVADARAERQ